MRAIMPVCGGVGPTLSKQRRRYYDTGDTVPALLWHKPAERVPSHARPPDTARQVVCHGNSAVVKVEARQAATKCYPAPRGRTKKSTDVNEHFDTF